MFSFLPRIPFYSYQLPSNLVEASDGKPLFSVSSSLFFLLFHLQNLLLARVLHTDSVAFVGEEDLSKYIVLYHLLVIGIWFKQVS